MNAESWREVERLLLKKQRLIQLLPALVRLRSERLARAAGLLPGEVLAYTVTGDAVNTAQRIESAAPPDGVLVSESTLALARNAFVFEPVPPLTLKGKSEPVAVFRVIGPERRATAERLRPPCRSTLGRSFMCG